jgi:hypothetical protein
MTTFTERNIEQLEIDFPISIENILYKVSKYFASLPLSLFSLYSLSLALAENKHRFSEMFRNVTEGYLQDSEISQKLSCFADHYKTLPEGSKVIIKAMNKYTRSPFGAADFDCSSCFNREDGDRRLVFDMLKDNFSEYPSYFVSIKDDENIKKARAIITIVDDVPIVWNCYTNRSSLYSSIAIANYLATKLQKKIVRKVNFSNCGRCNYNLLWVNGNIGYAVIDESNKQGTFEVEMDETQYSLGVKCEQCGGCVEEDDAMTDDDGNIYCQDCYYEAFAACSRCDSNINVSYDTYYEVIVGRYDTRVFCSNCVTVHQLTRH